jgi:hypothetical protein
LEETPYCAKARANTNGSNQTWSEYSILNFTTLADQASIYRNNNGTWTKGKGYIDTGSSYEKAQKVYIKINGTWTAGINT